MTDRVAPTTPPVLVGNPDQQHHKQRTFAQRMGCGEHCTALQHPNTPCQCQLSRQFFQQQRV